MILDYDFTGESKTSNKVVQLYITVKTKIYTAPHINHSTFK